MTQDMSNKISHHSQALAREMAYSRLLLGSFMSMPRVCLEYAWSMARVRLELARKARRWFVDPRSYTRGQSTCVNNPTFKGVEFDPLKMHTVFNCTEFEVIRS